MASKSIQITLSIILFAIIAFSSKDNYSHVLDGTMYILLFSVAVMIASSSQNLLGILSKASGMLNKIVFETRESFFLIILFSAFVIITATISLDVFGGIPHIQDSLAQYVHAKIFASGSLTAPSPQVPEFFNILMMVNNNGQWYSIYPPGHIIMLAIGHIVGMPWLVNPMLGGLTLIAIYYLAKETDNEKTARLAGLLTIFSPFIIFMSSEYMNHATSLLFTTCFILFFIKTVKQKSCSFAALAAIALGFVIITRTYTAIAISIPFAAMALYFLKQDFKEYFKPLLTMLVGILLFGLILLFYNNQTNGDPFVTGYQIKFGSNYIGFGANPWGEEHTLSRGIEQAYNHLTEVNKYLFEWPVSSLLFVFVLFVSLSRNIWHYLFILSLFILAGAHIVFFSQAFCFGPRYIYEVSGLLIILTACGILRTPLFLRYFCKIRCPSANNFTRLFVLGLLVVSNIVYVPRLFDEYSDDYWGINSYLKVAVESNDIDNALIFVTSKYRHFASANPSDEKTPIIYAINMDAGTYESKNYIPVIGKFDFDPHKNGLNNQMLIEHYPNRSIYIEKAGRLRKIR